MNSNSERSPLDDRQFDRLVDEELNEAERQALLARLDREPNGWRQCAMAFLEAQCWRGSLRGMFVTEDQARSTANPTAVPSVPRSTVARSPWPGRLGTLLAMAASFLLVFWIGSAVQRMRTGLPPSNFDPQVATVQPPVHDRTSPWRTVDVSDRTGRPVPVSTVRAVERNNVDDRWLESLPSAVPDDVRQAFQRTGHEIQQHRELVPVPLDDGRRLIVPVDQVDVHYIGNGSY